MLAVFTSFKPFTGAAADIQMRSLENWRAVFPDTEIVNFETATDESLPSDLRTVIVDEGKGKVPLFGSMVRWMEANTEANLFLYANGDILFPENLKTYLTLLPETPFLLTGQRVDIMKDQSQKLHGPAGMDYFFFARNVFSELPDVVMGRGYCDSALVAHCLRQEISVINATEAIVVLHQWHDYTHAKGGKLSVYEGIAALENMRNNGLRHFAPHVCDSTHKIKVIDGTWRVLSQKRSILRKLEWWGFYQKRWKWWPNFNQIWNIVHRGGKW